MKNFILLSFFIDLDINDLIRVSIIFKIKYRDHDRRLRIKIVIRFEDNIIIIIIIINDINIMNNVNVINLFISSLSNIIENSSPMIIMIMHS